MIIRRFSILAILVSLVSVSASAQSVVPIKTGDKLRYESLRFDARGSEIFIAATTPLTAEIAVSPEGRAITYSSRRVDKFNADHALVERISADGKAQDWTGKRLLSWLPKDRNSRAKFETGSSFPPNFCGEVDAMYTATPTDVTYKIAISGNEVTVKAVQYLLEGRWRGTCGSGKQVVRFVYSPELDAILESEILNYHPSSFLNVGSGLRLKSVN
jgi:hypothetical protein